MPVGTDGIADQTIDSGRYNAFVHDVETDLNVPRPISAGGTGANNARDAMIALGGELANQVVTNYDSFPFVTGSFKSDNAATAGPVGGRYFEGSVIVYDNNYTILHAYDIDSGAVSMRIKTGSGWGPWTGPTFGGDIQGNIHATGDIYADAFISRRTGTPNTGTYYFGNNTSLRALHYDGIEYVFTYDPVNIASTAASTLPTNGALTIGGGLGVAGEIHSGGNILTGGNINASGDLVGSNLVSSIVSTPNTGAVYFGNNASRRNLFYDGTRYVFSYDPVNIASTAGATSATTGALTIGGGLGVAGTIYSGTMGVGAGALSGLYGDGTNLALRAWFGGAIYFQGPSGTVNWGLMSSTSFGLAYTTASTSIETGSFVTAGGLGVGGAVHAVAVNIDGAVGGNAVLSLNDETATAKGFVFWERATGVIKLMTPSPNFFELSIDPNGTCKTGIGVIGRRGQSGVYDANVHNFYWNGGANEMWIGTSNQGTVNVTCDYRVKKDITPLNSTWDAIKALRPVVYTQREYTPPGATQPLFINNDTWQWGFLAHELQETLLPSAAHGTKDSPTDIQSPNLLAIVAALTKSLQEAMERIEVLECRTTSG